MDDFLTSAEVAQLLGVGPTSVKRWADSGVLPCVRTAGRHRRFARSEVESFRRGQQQEADGEPARIEAWGRKLDLELDPHEFQAELLHERARLGAWWRVADLCGVVLVELGERWQRGEISVLQEHLASERLARAIARCCESIHVTTDAPKALLASAPGEEHTLGLLLAELCLRELGWNVLWAGRSLPIEEIERRVQAGDCRMLGLSAAANLQTAADLEPLVRRLGSVCAANSVEFVLGGLGPWPAAAPGLPRFHRVRGFRELQEFARSNRG